MRHHILTLSALLLLALPHAAAARSPVLDVAGAARAGQRLEIRWSGLPGSVREVELELSLDGGRWVRISPELEGRERRYLWRVPTVTSAHARLRLRAGGDGFERELVASGEFRIESHEPANGACSPGLDWWRVGEHAAAPGWGPRRPEATLSRECSASVAEPDSRTQTSAPAPAAAHARCDKPIASAVPVTAIEAAGATRRYPMRS